MNTRIVTSERFYIPPRGFDGRGIRNVSMDKKDLRAMTYDRIFKELNKLGIGLDERFVRAASTGYGMDALDPTVTMGSMPVPIQFLQNWLPGFVYILTSAMNIDDFIGMSTSGSWEQEEIVQGVLELTGKAIPYGDYSNTTFSSWNPNYERRTIVRFVEGMEVDVLETARAAQAGINNSNVKREAAALSLEIERNRVGFYGYDAGLNRTYGFLNDPSLPAYVSVPNGASGSSLWANKTFLEIQKDIRSSIAMLRNASKDRIDPSKVDITLGVATVTVDNLSTTSDLGISVMEWLNKAYPRVRVVSAPELTGANGGANVFYLYADGVKDMSTDDGRVWAQVVPAKFQTLGIEQLVKSYREGYTNATSGATCKRPYAVIRRTGI